MKAKKILIVEDNKLEYKQLRFFLEEQGYVVCGYVDSFTEAVFQLHEFQPDLVLIDIDIRGDKNGIALALEINRSYTIPFIFTSIISDDSVVDIAVELAEYIHKPYSQKQVHTMIKRVLRQRQSWKSIVTDSIWAAKRGQNNKEQNSGRFQVHLNDIEWIETNNVEARNTLLIKTIGDASTAWYQIRKTLKDMNSLLPSTFIQVSNSHIINKQKVTEFRPIPTKKKGYIIINNKKITVTAPFLKKITQRFTT